MSESEFRARAVILVKKYYEENNLGSPSNIVIVWSSYILGNIKIILTTKGVDDNRIFEVTYDKSRNHIYFDAYNKEKNIDITLE